MKHIYDKRKKKMIRKILVPVDSSECSFAAANYAVGLAKTHGASIILIHVVEIHPYSSTIPFYMTAGG